jgi:serralysin
MSWQSALMVSQISQLTNCITQQKRSSLVKEGTEALRSSIDKRMTRNVPQINFLSIQPKKQETIMAKLHKAAQKPSGVIQGEQPGAWLQNQVSNVIGNKTFDDKWNGTNKQDVFNGSKANDNPFGGNGDDILTTGAGIDVILAGGGNDFVISGAGNDVVFGDKGLDTIFGQAGDDVLIGGGDADLINGGDGRDTITGGEGADALTGGTASDSFLYNIDSFTGAVFTPAANGINQSNLAPDAVTDFTIAEDRFVLLGSDLNLSNANFQVGASGAISGNSDIIVLTDPFANAAAAAKAIANNDKITADAGVFVYFNTNLGFSRLVHSADLGDGGNISVLANMTNQTGQNGINALGTFTANNFTVV